MTLLKSAVITLHLKYPVFQGKLQLFTEKCFSKFALFLASYIFCCFCAHLSCCKQRIPMSLTSNVNISCKAITPPPSMLFPWWMTNKEVQRQQLKRKIQLDEILMKKWLCIKCKWMIAKAGRDAQSSGYVLLLCLCSAGLSVLTRYVYNKIWKADICELTELISEVLEIACPCFCILQIYHARHTCFLRNSSTWL